MTLAPDTMQPSRQASAPAPAWQIGFDARPILSGHELFVGEWQCTVTDRKDSVEVTCFVEIGLQRAGTHVRTVGSERRMVDATVATMYAAGHAIARGTITSSSDCQVGRICDSPGIMGSAADGDRQPKVTEPSRP